VDAIAVEGLRKRYGDVQALDGVSFAVREGEVFGLLGPNGAGKSTTIRTLATLTVPDDGHARVVGHDVRREPEAVRRAIGYVPQDSGADTYATGRENLMLQGRIQGMGGRELRGRVDELLALVGIADAADRVVRGYSGGMRRRLDIALGLVHRPRVLFLDEPTTGLDPEARVAMWDEVRLLAAEGGLTILLTTHYLEEAQELCDRIAIIDRGHVVVAETTEALLRRLDAKELRIWVAERVTQVPEPLARFHIELAKPGKLVFHYQPSHSRLADLLDAVRAAGLTILDVQTKETALQDIFLQLTSAAARPPSDGPG
jgi:ABC-2 type transport system ATP-binding protein